MQAVKFKRWIDGVSLLSQGQRRQLLERLRPALGLDRLRAAIETVTPSRLVCPGCSGERHHKHGRDRGLQRYRCRACGKTFSALTGTPLARLRHRGLWLDYLERMLGAQSVRTSAATLGVHRNTSFRWRHRFLAWARHDRPTLLSGIAEADELFLLESQKGSRRLDRPPRKRGGV
ncbi:MAG TPA: IS1595 family transposase, partial [Massilia sp.]|nr:IS1595 family transposase [Massilia sp.]